MNAFLRRIVDARAKNRRPWEGVPRVDGDTAPRGLRRCIPYADPSFTDPLGTFKRTPDTIGSDIRNFSTLYGRGPTTTVNNGFNNYVGYACEQPVKYSMEALFVLSATSGRICGFNASADGGSSNNNCEISISAGVLNGFQYDGASNNATDGLNVFAVGALVHVILTSDGSNIRLYTNGVQSGFHASSNPGGATVTFLTFNGKSGGTANAAIMLLGNYANVTWTPAEVAARAADPWEFLIWPEDDILAQTLGAPSAGTGTITASLPIPVPLLSTAIKVIDKLTVSLAVPVPLLSTSITHQVATVTASLPIPIPGLSSAIKVIDKLTVSIPVPVPLLSTAVKVIDKITASLAIPLVQLTASIAHGTVSTVTASLPLPVPGLTASIKNIATIHASVVFPFLSVTATLQNKPKITASLGVPVPGLSNAAILSGSGAAISADDYVTRMRRRH